MAKVPAYHTDFGEHPAEYRDVYHDHDDCPDGRLILPHHRSSGTGGKPQCKKCSELTRRPVDEGTKRKILTLLDQHRIMTIATLRPDSWPQATTVGYANDGLTLYFLCGPDSQKAANLARVFYANESYGQFGLDPRGVRPCGGLGFENRLRLLKIYRRMCR